MVLNILGKIEQDIMAKITKIRGKGEFHRRLLDAGLHCGCIIKINKLGSSKEYLQVIFNGITLPLSEDEAAGIYVEAI